MFGLGLERRLVDWPRGRAYSLSRWWSCGRVRGQEYSLTCHSLKSVNTYTAPSECFGRQTVSPCSMLYPCCVVQGRKAQGEAIGTLFDTGLQWPGYRSRLPVRLGAMRSGPVFRTAPIAPTRPGANFIEVFHYDHHSSAAKPPKLGPKDRRENDDRAEHHTLPSRSSPAPNFARRLASALL